MKNWLVVGLVAAAVSLLAFQTMPRCTSLEPDTGKKGDTISVKGEYLDKKNLAEMYLIDGSKDIVVKISAQAETEIKFTVPTVKPGRYHLAVLTAKKDSMIEQPVVLTVE
jgi:IPT/TIG domain